MCESAKEQTTLDWQSSVSVAALHVNSCTEARLIMNTNWTEWVSSERFELHLNLELLACTACVFSESSRLREEPDGLVWMSSCHSDGSEESPTSLGAEQPPSSALGRLPRHWLVRLLLGNKNLVFDRSLHQVRLWKDWLIEQLWQGLKLAPFALYLLLLFIQSSVHAQRSSQNYWVSNEDEMMERWWKAVNKETCRVKPRLVLRGLFPPTVCRWFLTFRYRSPRPFLEGLPLCLFLEGRAVFRVQHWTDLAI